MLKILIFLQIFVIFVNTLKIPKVVKANDAKVYIHMMPWFETRETSDNGGWGIHWTMDTQNPDIIVDESSGKRQIAAYFYPETGPYASSDWSIIEYQLLLMKYSGVDGILIDWPGTLKIWDYPMNFRNTEAIIRGCDQFGLDFAIVYEDHNLKMAADAGFIGHEEMIRYAQEDMVFLRDNYFHKSNYIKYDDGTPLLLVFGPQTFFEPGQWSEIFSPLQPNYKPTFLTLWYQNHQAGPQNCRGEYPWIYSDFLDGLRNFYNNRQVEVKFGVAYPGFVTFYAEGGWGGPDWSIPHNGPDTFAQTLDMALGAPSVHWIQIATWNDYGEGTMIEPTREFGNTFLNLLQDRLQVLSYGDQELEIVKTLYRERVNHIGNETARLALDKVSQALNLLQPQLAMDILKTIKK